MRGKVLYLGRDEIVHRAKSQVGRPVLYHLEYPNGGTDPSADGPEAFCTPAIDLGGGKRGDRVADCIGFATWAGGFDRFCPNPWYQDHDKFPLYDGYINTDSMIEEATREHAPGTQPWFRTLPAPVAGCFIVGATFRPKLTPWRRVIGHIGVVVDPGCGPDCTGGLRVVHCSPYNYQFTGGKSAIWETSAALWTKTYPKVHFIELALPKPPVSAKL